MDIAWPALQALRTVYLEGSAGGSNYWTSEALLDSYDRTFARRIAWKWQWVLGELTRRRWQPPAGLVLDWGCGTGVGAREFVRWNGGERTVRFHDRSPLAMDFAARTLRREAPGGEARPFHRDDGSPAVLLVSHVLTELDGKGFEELVALARGAQCVVCVEPGARAASERIIALRQALLGEMHPVAPCTHRADCGLLTPDNTRHWCHFHGDVPAEIFSDPDWMRFGKTMGIDLRSLPLSFLVLDRRPPLPAPLDAVRVLGQARVYKGFALLLGCREEGVSEHRLQKRADPAHFRKLGKGQTASLQHWKIARGKEIVTASDVETPEEEDGRWGM